MGVLLAGVIVLALVAVVIAANRRTHQEGRPLRRRWLGNATAWTITVVAGVLGAVLVLRGVVDVIDPNTDTAPVAAGAILAALGMLGVVMVIRARRD